MRQEPVDVPLVVHDHLAIDEVRRVVILGRVHPLVEEHRRDLCDYLHRVEFESVDDALDGRPVPVDLPFDLAWLIDQFLKRTDLVVVEP